MITIRVYGEGYLISKLKIPKRILSNSENFNTETLLDLGFYTNLSPEFNFVYDFCVDQFTGILPLANTIFEIWYQRKKIAKIPVAEIVYQQTLFPLYTISYVSSVAGLQETTYYLKEKVVGCLGVYKMNIKTFDIHQFKFLVLKKILFEKPLLIYFNYNTASFDKIKDDCIVKSREIIQF